MRKSAITKILHGEVGQDFFRQNERYNKIMDEFCEHYEHLLKKLESNQTLLQEYKKSIETFDELNSIEAEAYYKEGFVFGVTLGIEIAKFDD